LRKQQSAFEALKTPLQLLNVIPPTRKTILVVLLSVNEIAFSFLNGDNQPSLKLQESAIPGFFSADITVAPQSSTRLIADGINFYLLHFQSQIIIMLLQTVAPIYGNL
jgi:hypothetical protein